MKFKEYIKRYAINVLESHPIGYRIGVWTLEKFDFLLPHEPDYWGVYNLYKKGCFRRGLVLDIGANRGHSARAFLKFLRGLKVISIEANRMHESSLERIKSKSGLFFDYYIAAAGEKSNQLIELYTPVYKGHIIHSATSTSYKEAEEAFSLAYPKLKQSFFIKKNNVNTLAIDDLNLNPCFIKLDIQGAESQAIIGMLHTIKKTKPVMLIENNSLSDQITELLKEFGYSTWSYDVQSDGFISGISGGNYGHHNVFYAHCDLARYFDKYNIGDLSPAI